MRNVAIVIGSALVLAGCAGVQREAFIHQEVGSYVYDRPIEAVWPVVKGLVQEKGYSFKESTDGGFVLTTEWKEEMASSNISASFTRYLVEGVPMGSGRCSVRFYRNSMTMGGGPGAIDGPRHVADARAYANPTPGGRGASNATGTRDLKMEWLVMQRAAPEDAGDLAAAAEERYR